VTVKEYGTVTLPLRVRFTPELTAMVFGGDG